MAIYYAKNRALFTGIFIVLSFIGIAKLVARPPESHSPSLITPLNAEILDTRSWIDANRLLMFVTNKSSIGYDQGAFLGKNDGLYYPFLSIDNIINGGQDQTLLFAGGLWIGGIDGATGETLATVSEYSDEYTPGPLGTSHSQAFSDPALRVYKLYRDSLAMNPNQDYLDWPVAQGAPVDNQGRPEFHGIQTLWALFHDGEPLNHNNNATGTKGLDIEVHHTVWAFDEPVGTDSIPPQFVTVNHIAGPSAGTVSVEVIDHTVLTNHDYLVVFDTDSTLGRVWHLVNSNLGDTVLHNQTGSSGDADGLRIFVNQNPAGMSHQYTSASPSNVSPVATADNGYTGGIRWYTADSNSNGELLFGGIYLEPNFWGTTTLDAAAYDTVEIRWRPMQSYTDLNGDGAYTVGEPYVIDDPAKTQRAFMYSQVFSGSSYLGFFPVPYTVWDVSDPSNPRQLNVVILDRDQDKAWNLSELTNDPALPNGGDQRFNYTWILGTDYDPTGTLYGDGNFGTLDFFGGSEGAILDAMWMLWLSERGTTRGQLAEECITTLTPGQGSTAVDTFAFTAPMSSNPPLVGSEANAIYIRYMIVNAGSKQLNEVLAALWFDPDLGSPSDDLVGCDPINDVFYCYNGQAVDASYGSRPPAFAGRLLEGPVVLSAADSGWVNGKRVQGVANLSLHGFTEYSNGLDPTNTSETYNYLNGLDSDGTPIIDTTTGNTTRFEWSGDPVTGTGFLDSNPDDKRLMPSIGPFNLAPGDTQYVVWKLAVGQGTDNLNSITKAREILNNPLDSDGDGVAYYLDNCESTFNPGQADSDGDGIGDACSTPTDVDEEYDAPLPEKFVLHQNYPNPFNPSTNISFDLPTRSEWNVTIYNVAGQVVRRFDGESSAGTVTFEWDASDFATGVYFFRTEAGEFSQTRKMLLIK